MGRLAVYPVGSMVIKVHQSCRVFFFTGRAWRRGGRGGGGDSNHQVCEHPPYTPATPSPPKKKDILQNFIFKTIEKRSSSIQTMVVSRLQGHKIYRQKLF